MENKKDIEIEATLQSVVVVAECVVGGKQEAPITIEIGECMGIRDDNQEPIIYFDLSINYYIDGVKKQVMLVDSMTSFAEIQKLYETEVDEALDFAEGAIKHKESGLVDLFQADANGELNGGDTIDCVEVYKTDKYLFTLERDETHLENEDTESIVGLGSFNLKRETIAEENGDCDNGLIEIEVFGDGNEANRVGDKIVKDFKDDFNKALIDYAVEFDDTICIA